MTSKSIYGCQGSIGKNNKYHYVYRITNIIENKHYYGVRSSKIDPMLDIGKKYFSSSRDLAFKQDQKNNKQNYKYKVVAIFNNRSAAEIREAFLHNLYDVRNNSKFYNRWNSCRQFSAYGMATYKDIHGNRVFTSNTDPRVLSGELVGFLNDLIQVKDINGNIFFVDRNDPRYISGELVFVHIGMCNVKDSDGNIFKVSITDPRYLSGELVNAQIGFGTYKDKNNNIFKLSVDDPRVLSGELVSINKGRVVSEEARRNMSVAKKGIPVKEETKKKISETTTGRPSPLKGTTKSEEFKKKVSNGMKGRKQTEEHKRNVLEAKQRKKQMLLDQQNFTE